MNLLHQSRFHHHTLLVEAPQYSQMMSYNPSEIACLDISVILD